MAPLLVIKVLHDFRYKKSRNYGSIVCLMYLEPRNFGRYAICIYIYVDMSGHAGFLFHQQYGSIKGVWSYTRYMEDGRGIL